MELVYTTRTSDFETGKHYRNPIYFEEVERLASKVTIEADYPHIKQAYEKAGIEVEIISTDKQVEKGSGKKAKKEGGHNDTGNSNG